MRNLIATFLLCSAISFLAACGGEDAGTKSKSGDEVETATSGDETRLVERRKKADAAMAAAMTRMTEAMQGFVDGTTTQEEAGIQIDAAEAEQQQVREKYKADFDAFNEMMSKFGDSSMEEQMKKASESGWPKMAEAKGKMDVAMEAYKAKGGE